jgi:ParB-like chromosome segregation protein Spo0J
MMKNIPIEQIIDDFDRYYGQKPKALERVEKLMDDIVENGLKNPPIVHKINENLYEIVEGIHRIRALKKLGWKEVPCKIVNHGPQATPYPRERY